MFGSAICCITIKMKIDNKNVVVTGGAGGIGEALCRELAAGGAKVAVSDLDLDAADSVAREINGIAIQCDVSQEANIQSLIQQVESQLGPIDLYCSNAGFGEGEPSHVASASNDLWQKNWEVHVMAHVWASRALLPGMIERGDGYLLNVASAAGLLAQIGDAAYSATKHAAVSFAESLAIGHGNDGIKVSVVCPQYVNTRILGITDNERKQVIDGVITPQDCARTIVDGIEREEFMILPHKQVAGFSINRATDPQRWLASMRGYRATILDDNGRVDFRKIFGI